MKAKRASLPVWFVYLLINPKTKKAFYAGITRDVSKRIIAHWRNQSGYPQAYLRKMNPNKIACHIHVVGMHRARREAFDQERKIIESTKGLLNDPMTCGKGCKCGRHGKPKKGSRPGRLTHP